MAIADGRLAPGTKLPPTRRADAFFGVSRNTAAEAYTRLQNEGLVVGRHGSGTYVSDLPPLASPRAPQRTNDPSDQRLNRFWLQPEVTGAINFWRDTFEHPPSAAAANEIDFRPAMVQSRLFPFDVFRRSMVRQLRQLEKKRPAGRRVPARRSGKRLSSRVDRAAHCAHARRRLQPRRHRRHLRRAASLRPARADPGQARQDCRCGGGSWLPAAARALCRGRRKSCPRRSRRRGTCCRTAPTRRGRNLRQSIASISARGNHVQTSARRARRVCTRPWRGHCRGRL